MRPRLDLTDEEHAELVRALRDLLDGDRFPLSPRTRRLKGILNKLEPPKASESEPFPPPEPRAEASHALRKRRR